MKLKFISNKAKYDASAVELMDAEYQLQLAKKALESADRTIRLNDLSILDIKNTLNNNK
jgi:hypothetical protein